MRRAAVSLALLLVLAGCAAAPVAPRTSREVALDPDEQGLWREAAEDERTLAASGRLLDAPELEAYLVEVLSRLQPPEVVAATRLRARVIRDWETQASAYPDGGVYVTTGMLAGLDDEAELAFVLGHELAHGLHRDSLRELRKAETIDAPAARSESSRQRELDADLRALEGLARAGYRLGAGSSFFAFLASWARDEGKPVKEGATHPSFDARIAALTARSAELGGADGRAGVAKYEAHLPEVLLVNARLELAGGRYARARAQAQRLLRLRPAEAAGHVLLGEIARRQAGPGDQAAALAEYRRAVELDPKLAEAWRGMGFALQRAGDGAGARRALATYLELAPKAPDRGHVRSYLDAPAGGDAP